MDLIVKSGQRQSLVPPGTFNVRVIDIRKTKFIGKRDTFEFQFEIADGPHRGVPLRGFVNAHYEAFTPYTKLYRWYRAATGEEPPPGEDMNLKVFFEKILKVEIETKNSKKTDNPFSNVTEILGVAFDLS